MNRQQMTTRPMQPAAEQMATQGRYGDSMLVHMNPVEVQGLASLSPTGELTTNPMTGQPEAFLPFLLPLLGSLGGSAMAGGALATSLGLGSLGATAMGAIGSGLATTAVTGDIKEGIMSGLTGFGIGKAFQGASELLSPEVLGAATDVANVGTDAAALVADQAVSTGTTAAKLGSEAAAKDALAVQAQGIVNAPMTSPMPQGQMGTPSPNFGSQAFRQDALNTARFEAGQAGSSAFMQDPAEFAKNFGKTAMTSGSLVPIAAGEGMRGQRMADKENERALQDYKDKKAATLARSTAVRDSAIQQARDDYAYQDYGYAEGGLVSVNPQEYMRQMNGVQTVGMNVGGPADYNYAGGMPGKGGLGNPAASGEKQRSVRPANVVTADQLQLEADALTAQGKDPRAGFTGEINYFRKTPQEAGIPVDPEDQVDPSGGNVDPSEPIDTGSGPISIGGKGGQGGPGYKDIMPSFDGSNEEAVTLGGSGGKRNFTMADMEGLMNGNNSSLYDDSAMTKEVSAGKGSAKSAVDSLSLIHI